MAYSSTAQGGKDFIIQLGNGASGAVTFTDTGDTVDLTAHGLINGDTVSFSVITTTTGIVIDTVYYVVGATANTFQVALTAGGTAIALTNNGTGTLDETFQTLAGLRSKTITINAEEIDITNQDTAQFKELLSGAGIRSMALSGSGIFYDDITFKKARTIVLSQALRNFKIIVTSSGDYWTGCFKITSMEQGGEYNAESNYSLSMSSSGAFTYTEV